MSSDQEALFKALDSYDWDKDAEFKVCLLHYIRYFYR